MNKKHALNILFISYDSQVVHKNNSSSYIFIYIQMIVIIYINYLYTDIAMIHIVNSLQY